MTYTHEVRVRYADIDSQGVVYNSHYLTFVDDAFDTWMRTLDRNFEERGWEVMLKKAELVWHSSARLADVMDIGASVSRWGNTSFDVSFVGYLDGEPIFDATVVYVMIDTETHRPRPVVDELREFLSD